MGVLWVAAEQAWASTGAASDLGEEGKMGSGESVGLSPHPCCFLETRNSSLSSWTSSRAGVCGPRGHQISLPKPECIILCQATWVRVESYDEREPVVKADCGIWSGMLEAGVDRIISQLVGPKLSHIFRPQTEWTIQEFLAAQKKEAEPAPPAELESQEPAALSQDASRECA